MMRIKGVKSGLILAVVLFLFLQTSYAWMPNVLGNAGHNYVPPMIVIGGAASLQADGLGLSSVGQQKTMSSTLVANRGAGNAINIIAGAKSQPRKTALLTWTDPAVRDIAQMVAEANGNAKNGEGNRYGGIWNHLPNGQEAWQEGGSMLTPTQTMEDSYWKGSSI